METNNKLTILNIPKEVLSQILIILTIDENAVKNVNYNVEYKHDKFNISYATSLIECFFL